MNTYKIEYVLNRMQGKEYREVFVEDVDSSLQAILKYFDNIPEHISKRIDIVRVTEVY